MLSFFKDFPGSDVRSLYYWVVQEPIRYAALKEPHPNTHRFILLHTVLPSTTFPELKGQTLLESMEVISLRRRVADTFCYPEPSLRTKRLISHIMTSSTDGPSAS